MAALRTAEKCSRTCVYAPLYQRLDALPATIGYDLRTGFRKLIWQKAEYRKISKLFLFVGAVFNRDKPRRYLLD